MSNSPKPLAIVAGVRTPFAKMGTDLAGVPADELGRIAVNALLARTGLDPSLIDEVIFGCVAQPADAANVARVIALRAGIPREVPAVTVHRNCASGCEALTQAHMRFLAGRGEVFVVGGTENMSRIPLFFRDEAVEKFRQLSKARSFGEKVRGIARFRPADFAPKIGLKLGLTDPVCGLNMGETAEILARENDITRDMQDEFALASHQKAIAAREKLGEEICPVYPVPGLKTLFASDNGPREGQSLEALAKLRPVFDRRHGTVTAGNASQITDGAVALLVMSVEKAEKLGFSPLGFLIGHAYAGCDPARMGLGPVHAMSRAESLTGLKLDQADLVEINEAFACQVLAVLKQVQSRDVAKTDLNRDNPLGEIDPEILNVNGGSIALGHPVGATGARLVLTSLLELKRRRARRALVTLCVGGGQGAALWLENPEATS
ncbi:MAG: thiolase family protein [Verrucomicrobia bacterium]|nr:thiolase family protein [Verrucomicrobiota bacterium]MCH8512681.1 thiolase family protein [Kiritimatiellia bacterium]